MAVNTKRKKELRTEIQKLIGDMTSQIKRDFAAEMHHKSGRSGDHGKKYLLLSRELLNTKNSVYELSKLTWIQDDEERKFVRDELQKNTERVRLQGKSINHASK